MPFDPSQLQPLVDKLKEPGVMSSEFQAFKSSDAMTKAVTVLMLLAFVGELIANACGVDTRLGMILTASVGVVAKVLNLLGVLGYTKARADVKVAAAGIVAAQPVLGPPSP